jgi:hypothetical protein
MPKYEEDEMDSPETRSIRGDMLQLSEELTTAIGELRTKSAEWARKDNTMRKAKAKAFLQAAGKNKEEREAKADSHWATEREEANIAEGEKNACLEHVRSLRAQLSAMQALLYANRAENDSIRYGQTQLS